MSVEISDIQLYVVNGNKTIKANGSFLVNSAVKIRFTLMDGQKGMFVGLPGKYYEAKDGSGKKWASDVEVLDEAVVKTLTKLINDAYAKKTGNLKSGSTTGTADQGKSKAGTEDQSNLPF